MMESGLYFSAYPKTLKASCRWAQRGSKSCAGGTHGVPPTLGWDVSGVRAEQPTRAQLGCREGSSLDQPPG